MGNDLINQHIDVLRALGVQPGMPGAIYAHLKPGSGAHYIKALDGDSVPNSVGIDRK